jgi:hypothetical protein
VYVGWRDYDYDAGTDDGDGAVKRGEKSEERGASKRWKVRGVMRDA